jgi:hypothetical protein
MIFAQQGKNLFLLIAFNSVFSFVPMLAGQEPKKIDNLVRIQEALKPPLQDFIQAIFDLAPSKRLHASIVSDAEWKELECDLMVQKLDRTKTVFGFWGLRELSYPIFHERELNRRQAIVKKIVNDAYFRMQIERILEDIKATENEVIAYWNVNDLLHNNSETLYYSILGSYSKPIDDNLNRSRMALEGATLFKIMRTTGLLAMQIGATGILNELFASAAQNRDASIENGLAQGLKQPLLVNSPYIDVCKDGFTRDKVPNIWTHGTGGDIYAMYRSQLPSLAAGIFTLGTIGIFDYNYYSSLNALATNCAFLYLTTNQLQTRMVQVARFFKTIDTLHMLVESNENTFGKIINDALDFNTYSGTFKQLISLLEASTFDEFATTFYSRGNVLLANRLMNDTRDELIPLLKMIAHIDSYYSIAKLFKEQNKDHAPFCFVEFVKADAPYLACEKCWTPLLTTTKPVLNSFDWNKKTHNKIVLTGPNGSGKSTVMKAISHAIILSQAWGVCPAHKATIRMFTGLRSSLSPREDLQQNLSTFMAEKRRIDDIKDYILKYKPEDSFFVLLDEPYRGTIESEAEYRIDLLAQELVPLNHCMMIMATHLEKPTTLPESTQGVFANYQLGLEEKADGKFVRTFTLLPGFAEWWFKDMFKRRRFIDQLLKGE